MAKSPFSHGLAALTIKTIHFSPWIVFIHLALRGFA
jgi:hypothetical protein